MLLKWLRHKLTWWIWWWFADQAYSPPFAAGQFSDTTSPIYPDRPIRPLPKRRLRSRLSPELAESILSQSASTASRPLFRLPFGDTSAYPDRPTSSGDTTEANSKLGETQEVYNGGKKNGYQFKGNALDINGDDGSGAMRRYHGQRQTPSTLRSVANEGQTDIGKHTKPLNAQSAPSSAESIDGYDSFENTNNKKKRKIPTSGTLGNHNSTLSAEMAHMGISSARDIESLQAEPDGGVGQYYGTGNSAIPAVPSGTGISGAGRGRYGRAGTRTTGGRSPLGVSINGSNALQAGRQNLQRREYASTGGVGSKGTVHL